MSKFSKKTVFNHEWCLHPDWSKWLEPDEKTVNNARCAACKKTFSLSNMGRQAIISHEKGPKHKRNIVDIKKQLCMTNFAKPSTSASVSVISTESTMYTSTPELITVKEENSKGGVNCHENNMKKYLLNDKVTKAEILWCLHTVMTHSPFRSNSDLPFVLQTAFDDSDIIKKFQLKRTKTSYLISFGLAPFFKSDLLAVLSSLEMFVICFDESLNKVIQKCQMDIHVRFWEKNVNTVVTRYFTSIFLEHSDAKSLLDGLKSSIPSSEITKILQLSMDGPAVNHKLHSLLQTDLRENSSSRSLIDIGSCGLHIVHGAFRAGHKSTFWDLNKFLHAIYNFFKDSPARRANYIRLTNSNIFPMKFCSVRWLENIAVAQRALDILPHLRVFVQKAEANKVVLHTQTYNTIKSMLGCSELLEAKLGFFISVASDVQGFLIMFQTSKPMAPFLYEEMYMMLHILMKRFIKSSIVGEQNSAMNLMKIDVIKKCNVLPIDDVNIGFKATRSLHQSKVPDTMKFKFKEKCLTFLQKMTMKLIERNPLRFKLVRGISCLSPIIISTSNLASIQRLDVALNAFMDCNRMSPVTADKVKSEFCKFIASPHVKKEMSKFNRRSDRLDTFYSVLMDKNTDYQNLFVFVKNVLIMSHGNATVESGFSINKALLIENMQEKSVIALRTVYDAVNSAGGLRNINISKQMILAARNSHSYYQEELERKKLIDKESKELAAKKKRTAEEIKQLEKKKMKIQQEATRIDELIKELKY